MRAHTLPINRLIVHHSASPLTVTVEDIEKWHVVENGWDAIGYHWVVSQAGILVPTRPIHYQGAHARGFNDGTLGVCLIGNNTQEQNRWTRQQIITLNKLLSTLEYIIPGIEAWGHRDLATGTECPGLDVRALLYGPRYGGN